MTKPAQQYNPLHARKRARRLAVQALYQWQLSDQSLNEIEKQFQDEQEDMARADAAYFNELLHKVPACIDELDAEARECAGREIAESGPVERAVLRIGIYELKHRLDVPYRVILNEAVSLAKTFGASESHRFVNVVLDKVAHHVRAVEIQSGPPKR